MSPMRTLHLWLVDDTPQWHVVVRDTIRHLGDAALRVHLTGFATGADCLRVYHASLRSSTSVRGGGDAAPKARSRLRGMTEQGEETAPQPLPDVILMDFYLGGERGDAITRRLREQPSPRHRPVIVGHSTVADRSMAIVAAGGDLVLPKIDADGINPHLLDWLREHLELG